MTPSPGCGSLSPVTSLEHPGATAWPDLASADWEGTRRSLHMWTQMVGKIRMATGPPLNHWWHVPLYVSARGLTTSLVQHPRTPFEIVFDFRGRRLLVETVGGELALVGLYPRSVADFYAELMHTLRQLDIDVSINPRPVEVEVAIPFPDDTAPGAYDAERAVDFWTTLVSTQGALREVSAGFTGKNSPVHFFWGAFDLAQTRFSGRRAPTHPGGAPNCPDWVMHEAYSHEVSSCGYWPGGADGGFFYAYAYPEPAGFAETPVPAGHYEERLGEFVLPYETVRTATDPAGLLVAFFTGASEAVAALARWQPSAPPHRSGSEST